MGTGTGEVQLQADGGRLPLFMRLSARVFGGMLFALYAAASPAQTANVESVAPLSGGTVWFNNWGMGPYVSPAAACRAYNCSVCGSLTYIGTVPNCCGYAALGYRDCQFTYQPTGQTISAGTVFPVSNAVCPTPAVNPATPYTYNPVTGMCERPKPSCPVDPLPDPLFPASDTCSNSLEKGGGMDVDNACGTLRTPDMVKAAQCVADKIHAALGAKSYSGPTATIRTDAYQNHLLEIWLKSQMLNTIKISVAFTQEIKQACVPVAANVNAEKARHSIKYQPSSSGSSAPHVEHRAIDVPEGVINALKKKVATYTTTKTIVNGKPKITKSTIGDVEDYINNKAVNPSASCTYYVYWGGRFHRADPVHFQRP